MVLGNLLQLVLRQQWGWTRCSQEIVDDSSTLWLLKF